MGLIDSIEPSSAWAPPMRPPLRRFSSVSRVPNTWVRSEASATKASMSSALAPLAAMRAACRTIVPSPAVTDRLSSTRMSALSPAASMVLTACTADCIVAEMAADRLMHTTASQPASRRRRKACSNRPGGGAAVCGSSSAEAIRR